MIWAVAIWKAGEGFVIDAQRLVELRFVVQMLGTSLMIAHF